MYRRLNTRVLLTLLVLLIILVIIIRVLERYKGERTFRSDMINIDTSMISEIRFYPSADKPNEVKLIRSGKAWQIVYKKKTFAADVSEIQAMLRELSNLKLEQIAANDKSKWKEFEVDEEKGVRVVINKGSKLMADFVVGRFSYSRQQNPYMGGAGVSTYIRVKDDDNVYSVKGYLNMLFNRSADSYRNGRIVNVKSENINKLTFIYPSDSSFILTLMNGKWHINEMPADSAKVANYVNMLSNINANDFADDFILGNLSKPLFSLKIEGNNFNPIDLRCYSGNANAPYVITSSQNDGTKFNADKNDLLNRIFTGKTKLLPEASGNIKKK